MPGLGDLSPQGTIAVGVTVGLISTSVQSLGLTLQRQSHLREDEKEYDERKSAWKRPRWQAGMLMFVASNLIGSTIQITTLPLPVLSTLQASGLVFNTAFATLLLKEPFTRFSAIGTLLTCVGAALIATFGAISEPAHNLQQLVDLLKARSFVIWMTGTLLVAFVTVLGAHVLNIYSSHKHIIRHWFDQFERPRSSSSAGSPSRSIKRSFTLHLPRPMQLRLSRLRIIRGLMYALISGILSAHSLLMAKSAVELIVRTVVDHINQFNRFESWLILLALLFFALTQLYYLHLGLRLCSTSVLYPFVFCIYNVIAILDGLIYFQQASLLSGLDAGLVALGTVILLTGVLALSWRLDDTMPQEPAPSITPSTPLGPGLGTFRSSEDNLDSPPYSSRRESTTDERAPLLSKSRRARTFDHGVPPEADQRAIWDELDDQENDVLSSLPKTSAPFLRVRKGRSGSASSQAISTTSEQSNEPGGAPAESSRRSSAPQSSMKGSRSASAGQADKDQDGNIGTARRRGHTVHFDDSARPSRFDAGGKSKDDKSDDATNRVKENG